MKKTRRPLVGKAAIAVSAITAASLAVFFWIDKSGPDAAEIARGQVLYGEYCAACHGAALEGAPDWQTPRADGRMPAPPHDASGHTWHHADAELTLIIEDGMSGRVPGYESDMPAFGEILSEEEIDAVLAYIKSTWPPRERAYQEERTRDDLRRREQTR